MNSKRRFDGRSFDLDLPTSREDIAALQAARRASGDLSLADALARLSRLELAQGRERRETSEGWVEFRLEE